MVTNEEEDVAPNEEEYAINPHTPDVWESLILRGVGKFAHQGKLAIFAIILHSRQQKAYQGTLGT